ncbi:MAG: hypothetical protein ACI8RD_013428 [Bacillariaceae sp.]|jgi:hypothetical protein
MPSQQLRRLKSLSSNKYIVEGDTIAIYANFAAKFIILSVKYLKHTDKQISH